MKLSEAQKRAVYHKEGACLVLAGPGSGKTTVITKRLGYLTDGITKPSKLLSVTFTRAAGQEMALRYKKQYPGRELPVFGTVHSLCNRIIYDYESIARRTFVRIEGDRKAKFEVIKSIWLKVNPHLSMPEYDGILSLISRKSNRPEYFRNGNTIRNFDIIYDLYREYKRKNNFIDFDDMIIFAKELLETDKRIQARWSKRYEYIQVDEGQDLSKAQFEVMRHLAGQGNIFVVADDDQGIYAFRGADPRCVLEFEKYYSNCVKYYLEENYRSTKRIVECASRVVSINKNRYEKNLFTNNSRGKKIEFLHCSDLSHQARFVCEKIQKFSQKGSVAVIYRNSLSALLFKLYLTYLSLDYSILGGDGDIGSDPIVKRVLSKIEEREENSNFIIPRPKKVFESLLQEGLVNNLSDYYERTGKSKIYSEYVLEFLETACRLYNSYKDLKEGIDSLGGVEGMCNITLSTVHSAKGLEFDTVFIVDLVNDEFPSREYLSGDMIEEERRLFYVAMTRAKSKLYLVYPEKRGRNIEEASVFYEEALRAINARNCTMDYSNK